MPYFTGPTAEAVYGGPVRLTIGNLYHVGNSMGQLGYDLLNELMNGVIGFLGNGPGVSALDLAILRDVGVPINEWYADHHLEWWGRHGGGIHCREHHCGHHCDGDRPGCRARR